MMDLPGLGPTNRFLITQRDRRWHYVLSAVLMASTIVVLALGLVGWPRLRSTTIHYDLIRLRADVQDLERRERELRLELEEERSPQRLAARAAELGMVQAAPAGLPAPDETEVVR